MAKLSLDGVTKRYGKKVAVDNISFEAQSGRVLGLLGPNGAGKTSTIRMITYITTPDSGVVEFNGKQVGAWSQERMGYLPEERGLYKKLKVQEQLLYFAELKGLSRSDAIKKVDYWLERFDALDWKQKKTQELSKGMQQKVQFISTILHEPDLLILDEPFSGLDPINTELLKNVIDEQKSQNRVILFASHRMEQVEQLCDDICLISDGKIIIQGAIREVKRSFGRNRVIIEHEGGDGLPAKLKAEKDVDIVHHTSNRTELKLLNGTPPNEILEFSMAHTDSIFRFECVEPSLNEIFVTAVENAQS
ncbi:MAG: ATP-binding cassette domain-containing protein [Rhodothermaceae bacterium]|nr:ATP-binding cassette domain-containing protein [Rhodothermaceae bacterium]